MQAFQLEQEKISWFTTERREWIAAVFAAAILGFGLGNGHTTTHALDNVSEQLGQKKAAIKKLETVDIPAIKSVAGCQAEKADVTAMVNTGDAEKSDIPNCAPVSSLNTLGHAR